MAFPKRHEASFAVQMLRKEGLRRCGMSTQGKSHQDDDEEENQEATYTTDETIAMHIGRGEDRLHSPFGCFLQAMKVGEDGQDCRGLDARQSGQTKQAQHPFIVCSVSALSEREDSHPTDTSSCLDLAGAKSV